MRSSFYCRIAIASCIALSVIFADQPLWDLGVIIDNDPAITYQKEIDIDSIENYAQPTTNIRALHSNNFIPPIIQEIKNPLINKNNIIKKYDEIISKLSTPDKILATKKSFLGKKFSSFFSFYKSLNRDQKLIDPTIDLMFIQNLYFANKFSEAKTVIEEKKDSQLSPELLLYKIKVNIKLMNIEQAKTDINYFIMQHKQSDLMPYVIYEKKLLEW